MSASNEKTILITGATGKQGGATLGTSLSARLQAARDDPQARQRRRQAVGALGAEWSPAISTTRRRWSARSRAPGASSPSRTPGRRASRGRRSRASASRSWRASKGVQHYVYSSVGSAHRRTGIPHFENKFRVEETVKALKFPSHVILRPVFFMENLPTPWFLNGDKLTTALKPETKLQMIAVDDIGKFGAGRSPRPTSSRAPRSTSRATPSRCPRRPRRSSELLGKPIDVPADPDRSGPREQRGHRVDARVVRRASATTPTSRRSNRAGGSAHHAQAVGARAEEVAPAAAAHARGQTASRAGGRVAK